MFRAFTSGRTHQYTSRRRRIDRGRWARNRYQPSSSFAAFTHGRHAYRPSYAQPSRYSSSDRDEVVLKVREVDYHERENAFKHHTNKYEITELTFDSITNQTRKPQLVVRRGQMFVVTLTFNREFNKEKDDIRLVFETGDDPRVSDGTCVRLLVSDKDVEGKWGAVLKSNEGKKATFHIWTPNTCYVAKWNLSVESVEKGSEKSKTYQYEHDVCLYTLLNPWNKDDTVYMENDEWRNEYVLEDHGRLYRGTKKQISEKPWNFGQFEDFMLDCCLYLLDRSGLSCRARGNPVSIARKISAIINESDDGGVLVGNWSGDYKGGQSPLSWVGSVRILEKYWRDKEPVCFGQCWVFSGLVTTVCRAIGLPARSVTNFSSAHDTDGSLTIDYHWSETYKKMPDLNYDSVWSFHVWNDVWMERPDLPDGYGGWQAIDSTPQETSGGVYCAGPASVTAIKQGDTHLLHDTPFIFAEVNADKINWIVAPDGESWVHTKDASSLGKYMSTKAIGSTRRCDVTNDYKYEEGSMEERRAVLTASKATGTKPEIFDVSAQDLEFKLLEKDFSLVGQPFRAVVEVTNTSSSPRTVDLVLQAETVHYTGVEGDSIKEEKHTVECGPKQSREVSMTVAVDEYMSKLVDMFSIKVSCMGQVQGCDQFFCDNDDFRLVKPDLLVTVPEVVEVNQEYRVEMSFTNPLNMRLTECEFTVEGGSLQKPLVIRHKSVQPNEKVEASVKIKAKTAGVREILAIFNSKELSDIHGSAKLTVKAA